MAKKKILIKTIFILAGIFLSVSGSFSQKAYFQQRCEYDIEVKLDDKINFLTGTEAIRYTNNSKDTLNFIWMHIWPNAYKDRNTALCKQLLENGRRSLYFAEEKDRGYIDSLNFHVNGESVKMEYDTEYSDICKITPQNPVKPGETITITTPFRVKIPSGKFSRFGHIGESYFITQWFPKPAVYDLNGWNQMPYLDQGEFYSEFGSFKVAITLPDNYVVAATGELQEPSELTWINAIADSTAKTTLFTNDNSFPASSDKFKTITFKQDSIHDFAWFADKRFHILKGEVELPASKRKVVTWAYFTNAEADLWMKSIKYINDAIHFYSEEIGDYPYSQYTGIDGTVTAGGGMEYPMITVINSSGDGFTLDDVLAHEIGHSWFYGILGFNERTHGWMDEGINSFYELGYIEHEYPGPEGFGKNDFGFAGSFGKMVGIGDMTMKEGFDLTYKLSSYNNQDQPATITSADFTSFNYGAVMYRKTALAFGFLEGYLGKDLYRNCMKEFYEKWKFKHPGPDDIKFTFEKVSGKKLDWFFDEIMGTNKAVNYKPGKMKCNGDSCTLKITNKSDVPAPFYIRTNASDKMWFEGFTGSQTVSLNSSVKQRFWINDEYSTLLKSPSKSYNKNSIINFGKKISLKAVPQLSDRRGVQNLYLLPVAGWNRYNQWMGGLYFSNVDFVPQPFEFNITPLYDFKNNEIAGMTSFEYHVWPRTGVFSDLSFALKAKRFAYENVYSNTDVNKITGVHNYSKLDPGVNFTFRKKIPRSTITHRLSFRSVNIWLDETDYVSIDSGYNAVETSSHLNFNELMYNLTNKRVLDPFNSTIKIEQGKDHMKLYGEFNYHFSYAKSKKGIDVRLFAGGFIYNKEEERNYNFRMSGWEGSRDYKFDEIYFGRTDDHGFWDNQFLIRDGGFKVPTAVGQSNKWITSMNVSVDLPVPLPISLFGDVGTYEGIKTVYPDINNVLMFDAGISVKLVKDVLEVYFPLFNSDDIQENLDTNDIKFFDKVRFVFDLNKLSAVRLRNSILQSFQ